MTERTADGGTVAPLVGTLPPQCQRDLDALRRFVHAAISQASPATPVSPSDFRDVLLTGATGFMGRFFLCDLLQQKADLVVHCLVRADSAEHGQERVRAALQQAEIWDESFAPRIQVVVGDIGETRFGLPAEQFDSLCQQIDAVYYLAADINLTSSYTMLRTEFRPPCQRWCHSYKGLGNRGWIFPGYAPGLNTEKFAPADVG